MGTTQVQVSGPHDQTSYDDNWCSNNGLLLSPWVDSPFRHTGLFLVLLHTVVNEQNKGKIHRLGPFRHVGLI